jgi:hypothetical protein
MMQKFAERMWGAALSMSLGCLIDRFLDRIEELSGVIAPAPIDGLVCSEARTRALLD